MEKAFSVAAVAAAILVSGYVVHVHAGGVDPRITHLSRSHAVLVPHLVARPSSARPHLTRSLVIGAVAKYWSSLASATPSVVQFGIVNTHLSTGGARTAWIVSYPVDFSPPSGGAPGAKVGPPNVRTMTFVVDDATGTVLEAIGYYN